MKKLGFSVTDFFQSADELAKKLKDEDRRGVNLKLTEDELAFYDALEVNDSAVKVFVRCAWVKAAGLKRVHCPEPPLVWTVVPRA